MSWATDKSPIYVLSKLIQKKLWPQEVGTHLLTGKHVSCNEGFIKFQKSWWCFFDVLTLPDFWLDLQLYILRTVAHGARFHRFSASNVTYYWSLYFNESSAMFSCRLFIVGAEEIFRQVILALTVLETAELQVTSVWSPLFISGINDVHL